MRPIADEGVAGLTCGLASEADSALYRLGDGHAGQSLCREWSIAHGELAARGSSLGKLREMM
jgi:hypothetical protein